MKFALFSIFWLLTACGLTSTSATEQTLTIEMAASKTTPDGAEGDVTPKYQNYTITAVNFLSEDGTETTELYGATDGKEYKIIERDQIIFKKDIGDLKGNTYSGITVSFNGDVTGASENSDDHSFILSDPNLVLSEAFTIEKGKSITLYISVLWKNTVLEDAMSEPGFKLSLD
ncbi:MAG: hypothetical protein AB7T49_12110 [Oligoflexales bacterium]